MGSAKESIAKRIVDDVHGDVDVELWHTADGLAYLSMKNDPNGHFEHHPLKTKKTKQWLGARHYTRTKDVVGSSILSNAINVLEGFAQNGPVYETSIRIGGNDGAIYIDKGDKTWDAIEITAAGWKVVQNPPVKFRRPDGMLPLPEPVRGGSLDDLLKPLLTAESDESWLLMKAWLLGLLRPTGPYPILAFRGEQDTAKSYTQKLIRDIVDPNKLKNRRPAKTAENLMIAANNNWVVSFDNMSKISDELSDDLCCISTGGGIAKRAHYTDSDEIILEVCRPVVMNGIENVITRPDLLDRSIIITLHIIPPEKRVPEAKLIADFNERLPKILGALLDAAVIAMQNQDEIVLNDPYRMANFVKWAAAGLGDEGDRFQEAYKSNRDLASRESIEDDFLFIQLRNFIRQFCGPYSRNDSWMGNSTKLLETLRRGLSDQDISRLPKAANVLSGKLRRLTPAFRNAGISVQQPATRDKKNTIQWEISTIKS